MLLRLYDVKMNTAKNIPAEVTWMSDETESTYWDFLTWMIKQDIKMKPKGHICNDNADVLLL